MEDAFGIVYHFENAQQFWSEIDDVVTFPSDKPPTLVALDSALRRFLSICGVYHEQYLQSPLQLQHACDLILNSELFAFHSERMCDLLLDDAQTNTDPHVQFIIYNVLLSHGQRHPPFMRLPKRWAPLLPLCIDHILVDIDLETVGLYYGTGSSLTPLPIEARLRSTAIRLLYEVCRVQKMAVQELKIFTDDFLDYLFELVEQTRDVEDDSFNYSIIKLIVSLNEQFMVAALSNSACVPLTSALPADHMPRKNRVLNVLMRRLHSSKTFGVNMIFMLNRATRSPDDLCMQLLVLKLLYLMFTTSGAAEYFYINDLCVLVDVFIRELTDLDDSSESLRHTYLRVLHPLLTKTQLHEVPYKRPQIVRVLESLISNPEIREVTPTTRRLVERCLSGDWCVQFRKPVGSEASSSKALWDMSTQSPPPSTHSSTVKRAPSKSLKPSKSVGNLRDAASSNPRNRNHDNNTTLRKQSNDSTFSLPGIATAAPPLPIKPRRAHANSNASAATPASSTSPKWEQVPQVRITASLSSSGGASPKAPPFRHTSLGEAAEGLQVSPLKSPPYSANAASLVHPPSPSPSSASSTTTSGQKYRRSAPPPPERSRRKPPAVPVGKTASGATLEAISKNLKSGS